MALNKNNPNVRAKQQDKTYNGKVIKPVLYIGTWVEKEDIWQLKQRTAKSSKILRENLSLIQHFKLDKKVYYYTVSWNGTTQIMLQVFFLLNLMNCLMLLLIKKPY